MGSKNFKNVVLLCVLVLMNTSLVLGAQLTYLQALQKGADNFAAKNYADAKVDYLTAASLAKTLDDKATAHLLIGTVESAQQKYADARAIFSEIFKETEIKSSTRFQAEMMIGTSYMAEEKFDQARAAYDQALAMKVDPLTFHFLAQLAKAKAFLLEQKYVLARDEFEKLDAYKKDVPYSDLVRDYFVGQSYWGEQKFEISRTQFNKVLNVKPDDIVASDASQQNMINNFVAIYQQKAQLGVAKSYFDEKNYSQAKEEYNKVLQMKNLRSSNKAEAEKQLKLIEQAEENKTTK